MRHDGVTWLLPLTGVPLGVVYNADLLEAAGLERPRLDWTWDDLVSLAREEAVVVTQDADVFVSGKACMILCQPIDSRTVDVLEFEVGFASCPLEPLNATPVVFVGFGVTRSSPDPLAAFRVMRIMTSPEVEPFWASLGFPPMHESSIDAFADRWGEYSDVVYHFLKRPVVSV